MYIRGSYEFIIFFIDFAKLIGNIVVSFEAIKAQTLLLFASFYVYMRLMDLLYQNSEQPTVHTSLVWVWNKKSSKYRWL